MRVIGRIGLTMAFVGASGLLSLAAAGADVSAVQVVPSTDLAGGDTVAVSATGLTPSAEVQVIECDQFVGDPEQDCGDLTTTSASPSGAVSVGVALVDPVYRSEPFGDPTPVYCRADVCRIFLVWTDGTGTQQVAASDTLEFTGSPATIAVRPSSNLPRQRAVAVSGTAYGAEGHTVQVLEEACFSIVQGSGCYGQYPSVSTTVRSDGSYSVRYKVHRFLADGTDCADPDILGACEVNVVVLDASGTPDDSFGVSRRGQPAAFVTFRSH